MAQVRRLQAEQDVTESPEQGAQALQAGGADGEADLGEAVGDSWDSRQQGHETGSDMV